MTSETYAPLGRRLHARIAMSSNYQARCERPHSANVVHHANQISRYLESHPH